MNKTRIDFVLLLVLSALLVACKTEGKPHSAATSTQAVGVGWNTEPSAMILKLYSPYTTAGLAGAYDDRYYIPEVQIWGNGRIVWVTQEGQRRRVLEGQLTTEQMEGLLQQIVEVGFFEWEDEYYTLGGNSSPPMYMQVNLIGQSKEMSEHGGAPEAYYELEDLLLKGAGAVGHDCVPAQGYLSVEPLSIELEGPEWPDGVAVTPKEVGEGKYIEGETLKYVWETVNRNPRAPVYVRFEGETYRIMVQIPGVSYFEPSPQ
jgi:hypothetical protein